mgnify:CR=1 FL=1
MARFFTVIVNRSNSFALEIALFNFNVDKVALLSQRSISIALYDLGVGQRLQLLRSDQAIAVQG